MKKIFKYKKQLGLSLVLALLVSCYGSFTLTKKLYAWNGSLGDKYVNSLVMFVLIAPYGAIGFIDWAFLNTVEFWTGSNPLAMPEKVKDSKMVRVEGVDYRIDTQKHQIDLYEMAGDMESHKFTLVFEEESNTWFAVTQKGKIEVAHHNPKNPLVLEFIQPNQESVFFDLEKHELMAQAE